MKFSDKHYIGVLMAYVTSGIAVIFLVVLFGFALLLGGCVQCGKCPIENVVIQSPYTGYPIIIDEGFFDDMTGIYTEKEFNKEVEELKKLYSKEENSI